MTWFTEISQLFYPWWSVIVSFIIGSSMGIVVMAFFVGAHRCGEWEQLEEVEELLHELEASVFDHEAELMYCPICHGFEKVHEPDCRLAKFLREG